jgi:DNA primase
VTAARFEKWAETYLNVTLRGGSEWMAVCPLHDDRGASLQINVNKGLWVCFGCQQGGTVKSLSNRLGVNYADPSVPVADLRSALERATTPPEPSIEPLPESYLKRFGIEMHPYWEGRGFTEETIDRFDLGYDFMKDQLTIPYRTPEGDLLGVIRRRLTNEFPRYLYPKGFDRTGSLFASWEAVQHVGLVEGSLDAVMNFQNGLPSLGVYGSSVNERQVRLLRRLGVKRVTLFFDYDDAGLKAFKQVPEDLDGFIVDQVWWDEEKYCWHREKRCKCRGPNKTPHDCKCGRIHQPDPGSINKPEFDTLMESRKLCGRSAKLSDAQNGPYSASSRRRHA